MAEEDWSPVPAHQMEEVQQGQCKPREQQGGGREGDEEELDKDSDKEKDHHGIKKVLYELVKTVGFFSLSHTNLIDVG